MSRDQTHERASTAAVGIVGIAITLLVHTQAVLARGSAEGRSDTVNVRSFELPPSSFLSEDSRAELRRPERFENALFLLEKKCSSVLGVQLAQIPAIRRCSAETFYHTAYYQRLINRYHIQVSGLNIGGVPTEIFVPAEGVDSSNDERVLINLHGGGFVGGARFVGRVESIPIASLGKIKVISIDYRMGPEYEFPAASEDVAAVYQELLKTYRPENIGIYGCSAGGLLTTEAVAWFQRHNLPSPGAIGVFCSGGNYFWDGDSGHYVAALHHFDADTAKENPYFKSTAIENPLAFPSRSDQVMKRFPPTLMISSTRDQTLSSVIYMHSRLVALGVDAELHLWEGLDHQFFADPELSESREAYAVIVQFFHNRLGIGDRKR